MAKHKKWLGVCLGCVLSAAIALPAWAVEFQDMDEVPWRAAAAYITQAAESGLMVGEVDDYGDRIFRPQDSVTYCETAQLLYTLLSAYNQNAATTEIMEKYADWMTTYNIPAWAQPAVSYCMSQGILMVSDIANFCPNGYGVAAPREKVALYFGRGLSRMMEISTNASLDFNDADEITANEVPYIDLMVRAGIISGDDYGNFNPQDNITRTEMAIIAVRTQDYLDSL